jgi:hypothetical protein
MPDSFIPRRNPSSTDHRVDAEQVTVGATTVLRERLQIVGGGSDTPIPLNVKQGSNGNNAAVVTLQPTANSGVPTAVALTASTALLVAAATDSRKELIIQNLESAANNIYVGTTNGVTVGGGVEIIPGGHIVENSWKGAVYVIAASNMTIIVWEKIG